MMIYIQYILAGSNSWEKPLSWLTLENWILDYTIQILKLYYQYHIGDILKIYC